MIETHPISFSPANYRLIASGVKTQARFLMQPQPTVVHTVLGPPWQWFEDAEGNEIHGPFPKPPQLLFVREALELNPLHGYFYRRDVKIPIGKRAFVAPEDFKQKRIVESVMPRSLARLWLVLKTVRAEQLQDITEPDAAAEGAARMFEDVRGTYFHVDELAEDYYGRQLYFHLTGFKRDWNNTHPAMPWDLNPWVWVIEFKPLILSL
jgi:hypothetical protein